MRPSAVSSVSSPTSSRSSWVNIGLIVGAVLIAALLVWQGVTAAGTPDPTVPHLSPLTAILDVGALVFREGIECVVVLTAITASLRGSNGSYRQPITIGGIIGLVATVITWFIAVRIVSDLTTVVPALALQAWTGLLALVVLLIVMNWFFHRVYWTGWISFQNRRKQHLVARNQDSGTSGAIQHGVFWGLVLLGLASVYREGFEVVLFLQSYRLQLGNEIVLYGALVGLLFAGILAFLSFFSNVHVPYKRMLVVTGVVLVLVLFIMVGEQVFEMEQAGWFAAANVSWLDWLPDWVGTWLSIFPDWWSLLAQALALLLVLGSYFLSRYQAISLPKRRGLQPFAQREAPPSPQPTAPAVEG